MMKRNVKYCNSGYFEGDDEYQTSLIDATSSFCPGHSGIGGGNIRLLRRKTEMISLGGSSGISSSLREVTTKAHDAQRDKLMRQRDSKSFIPVTSQFIHSKINEIEKRVKESERALEKGSNGNLIMTYEESDSMGSDSNNSRGGVDDGCFS